VDIPRRAFGLLAAGLAVAYGLLWATIDYLFERTFTLHVWDVGANFVLTRGTSPPGLDYGHLTSAPQNLIYVLFIPVARTFPDPMVLVYLQDALLASGGVVIYLLAAKAWGRPGLALLLEGLYLFNYALFGAPFYPDHYEVLFSVLFPIAFFLYLTHRIPAASGMLVLTAFCSSLAAVEVGVFVLLFLWPDLVPVLRAGGRGLLQFVSLHRYPLAAGVAAVVIFMIPIAVLGVSETLTYGHFAGGGSPNVLLGLETYLPTKLGYILLVLLPFVSLLTKSRFWLLLVPYFALTLLAGANNFDQFAYQYTYTIGAILFIAVIQSLRNRYPSPPVLATPTPSIPSVPARPRLVRLRSAVKAHPELAQITVVIVVLGFLILPYSPGNAFAGPYATLPFRDYDFPSLVTVTPYDRALWNMASEVPMNGSVLIEEDMPMLTNRATWYEPGSYDGENVQYALTDPTTNWFVLRPPSFIGPYPVPMIQWANELHQNRTYGIASEYDGAILFEAGYHGPPASFVPDTMVDSGTAFVGSNATHDAYGPATVSVDSALFNSTAFFTANSVILPPGEYSMNVELLTSSLSSANHVSFGLWSSPTTAVPGAVLSLKGSNFSVTNNWTRFALNFSVGGYLQGIRIGAYEANWPGILALASVNLDQTSPG
jgi:uncharacterized membrane protein